MDLSQILLAENGKPLFTIVTPADPSPSESLAAEELSRYLGEISDATFRVSSRRAEPALLVCQSDSVSKLAPDTDFPELAPDGYCVAVRNAGIFLMGSNARAVLYAVYDFLGHLGCDWLAPDFDVYQGASCLIPRQRSLKVALEEDIVESPVLKYRKLYVEEGHSHNSENLRQLVDWMPKRRFNILVIPTNYQGGGRVRWDNWREELTPELQRRGIRIEVGGHGYENFLNAQMEGGELFFRHPEWFGMNSEGERDPSHRRVLCTSNSEACGYLERNVLEYLEKRPEIEIFDFWPPDGARWCECPECEALGSPSDRHARMVSRVSVAVRQVRPDVVFECIAYSSYVAPPETQRISPEVLVDFCPINQRFEVGISDPTSARNAQYAAHLREWQERFQGDMSIYSYYRKYAWNSLPILLPHYMQEDLRFYRSLGLRGVSSYAEPGDWATYELNHYVLGALAWDPGADVDALVNKFAALRFGSERETALAVYARLEQDARRVSSIPFTSRKSPEVYREAKDNFQNLRRNLAEAERRTQDKAVASALGRLGLTLDYLLMDIELLQAEAEERGREEREALVDRLLDFFHSHEEDGVFLYQRIRGERLKSRYGLGG